jgi:hypothetical protein
MLKLFENGVLRTRTEGDMGLGGRCMRRASYVSGISSISVVIRGEHKMEWACNTHGVNEKLW